MVQKQDRSRGETLSSWQQLTGSMLANLEALSHLEGHRVRLTEILGQAQDLNTQQAALTASKQEISLQLQQAMDEGRVVAAFLRNGIRERFGKRSEKMVEFGIQPFRGLRRKAQPTPTIPAPQETPSSPENSSQTTPITPVESGT